MLIEFYILGTKILKENSLKIILTKNNYIYKFSPGLLKDKQFKELIQDVISFIEGQNVTNKGKEKLEALKAKISEISNKSTDEDLKKIKKEFLWPLLHPDKIQTYYTNKEKVENKIKGLRDQIDSFKGSNDLTQSLEAERASIVKNLKIVKKAIKNVGSNKVYNKQNQNLVAEQAKIVSSFKKEPKAIKNVENKKIIKQIQNLLAILKKDKITLKGIDDDIESLNKTKLDELSKKLFNISNLRSTIPKLKSEKLQIFFDKDLATQEKILASARQFKSVANAGININESIINKILSGENVSSNNQRANESIM